MEAAAQLASRIASVPVSRFAELAVALLCVAAAVAYLCTQSGWRTDGIPGDLGWPLIHDDLMYILKKGPGNRLAELANRYCKLYGDVYRHRLLGEVVVSVGSLDMVKTLLAGEGDLVSGKWPPSTVKMLGSQSVLNMTGTQHARVRKMLVHLFAPDAMRGYLPGIVQLMERRLAGWAASEEPVPAFSEVKELTMDVLMELVMGCSVADSMKGVYDGDPAELWHDHTDAMFSLPINLPGTKYNRGLKARKILVQAARQILARMADAVGPSKSDTGGTEAGVASSNVEGPQKLRHKFKSMGQMLLEARDEDGQPFTMQQMEDMCITFMFTGHDTTASAMAVLLDQLAQAPELVQKLRDEQAAVIAEHGEAYTEASLKSMVYAEATMREALRFTPIAGSVPRVALRDFNIGGYRIRKGTRVWVNLRMVLNDPQWRSLQEDDPLAPTVFNPDRWLGEAATRLGWIAFGHRQRMCVGYPLAMAEIKVLLAVLARKYTWELLDPGADWTFFPMPGPVDGRMPIRVTPLQAWQAVEKRPKICGCLRETTVNGPRSAVAYKRQQTNSTQLSGMRL